MCVSKWKQKEKQTKTNDNKNSVSCNQCSHHCNGNNNSIVFEKIMEKKKTAETRRNIECVTKSVITFETYNVTSGIEKLFVLLVAQPR